MTNNKKIVGISSMSFFVFIVLLRDTYVNISNVNK